MTKGLIIPQHIAIIMDGNRRWARERGLEDSKGHEAGLENLKTIVEAANKLGVKTITVYALSTENLKERSKREVTALLKIIENIFKNEVKKLADSGVRINILGEMEGLPGKIRKLIDTLKDVYIKNESIRLNIALNYGGRRELLTAIQKLIKNGIDVNKLSEEQLNRHLYTCGQCDPDLVIRTGGHIRLSNFLLWQTAYSELYFTKKFWPAFTPADLKSAIIWFNKQKRNFGK